MSTAPIYVVVCQNDKPHPRFGVDTGGPIVHESYTSMTLEQAQRRCSAMELWGACRVGRVAAFEADHPGAADLFAEGSDSEGDGGGTFADDMAAGDSGDAEQAELEAGMAQSIAASGVAPKGRRGRKAVAGVE